MALVYTSSLHGSLPLLWRRSRSFPFFLFSRQIDTGESPGGFPATPSWPGLKVTKSKMATTVPSIISPSSSSSASAEFNVAKGHVSAYAYAEGDEFWLWGRADDTTTAEDKERVVSCYDPLLEVWETHECSGDIPPPECRCYGTSATLDGSIYLYGGGSLAKLEPGTLYQVDSKSWELNICFTTASRAPPAQQLCKMVAFEDKELKKKLVLFGASGSPTTAEESSSLVWSNKVHVFDLDESKRCFAACTGFCRIFATVNFPYVLVLAPHK